MTSAATVSELLDTLSLEELGAMRAEVARRFNEHGRDLRRIEEVLEAKRLGCCCPSVPCPVHHAHLLECE